MELPLDHFRLLGVSPVANTEVVLRTLEQRLDRTPGPGFTSEALEARAELLRTSAELLGDAKRRQDYECLLTEQTSDGSGALPALEVSSALEVGGLLLLMESGQPAEAFEGARRSLQPPQAPALGSGREADLTLLAALALGAGLPAGAADGCLNPPPSCCSRASSCCNGWVNNWTGGWSWRLISRP